MSEQAKIAELQERIKELRSQARNGSIFSTFGFCVFMFCIAVCFAVARIDPVFVVFAVVGLIMTVLGVIAGWVSSKEKKRLTDELGSLGRRV